LTCRRDTRSPRCSCRCIQLWPVPMSRRTVLQRSPRIPQHPSASTCHSDTRRVSETRTQQDTHTRPSKVHYSWRWLDQTSPRSDPRGREPCTTQWAGWRCCQTSLQDMQYRPTPLTRSRTRAGKQLQWVTWTPKHRWSPRCSCPSMPQSAVQPLLRTVPRSSWCTQWHHQGKTCQRDRWKPWRWWTPRDKCNPESSHPYTRQRSVQMSCRRDLQGKQCRTLPLSS
jgi:hypothetical protein